MFIDEDDAKELFAGQVAIAVILGNENDGDAHSASQYVEAIKKNNTTQDPNFFADEAALGQAFLYFNSIEGGRGQRIKGFGGSFEK
jgi:hypothetical protein